MKKLLLILFLINCVSNADAQLKFTVDVDYNLTESKVPAYTLPNPLVGKNGKKIVSVQQWKTTQRPYIYHLFEENVYGRFPSKKIQLVFKIKSINTKALNGTAIRKTITACTKTDTTTLFNILLYTPTHVNHAVPVFAGLNFSGNQAVSFDTGITISTAWVAKGKGVIDNHATDSTRGTQIQQWHLEELLKQGFGLATMYYGDVEPDNIDGYKTGIRTKLKKELQIEPEEWSAIGAWAWALCRMMDYLQIDKNVNARQVAIIGHSRLGKAALWAAANDERFALVVSNESGEGGAALSKRYYGETIGIINKKFPHWFATNYKKFNDNTAALPLDQHMLLALIAPRPLYVASADGDQWSDPKGEFLSAVNASSVYALFNENGVGVDRMPALHEPVGDYIRYHIRSGKHDVTDYDWKQYIQFAKYHFKIK